MVQDRSLDAHTASQVLNSCGQGQNLSTPTVFETYFKSSMGSLTTLEVISIFSSWDPGQTFGDPSIGEYRVKDIFQYIQKSGKKPKPVPLNRLMEEFLSGESDAEVGSDEFSGRSDSADTSYPIIVVAYREGYMAIADGRHRFYKTLMQYYNRRFVEIVQSLDIEVSYPKVKDVITRVKDVQASTLQIRGKVPGTDESARENTFKRSPR